MTTRTTLRGASVALCLIAVTACADGREDGIADEVSAALERSADVDPRQIDVEVTGPTVVLSGEVDTLLAKQEAVALARAVPGVTSVVDRIEIDPYYRPDDVIERRVSQALMVDPSSEMAVDVEVRGGVVRLGGWVNPSEIERARRIAASVRGVQGVVDQMQARPLAAR